MAGATGHRPFFLLVSSLPSDFDEIKETSQCRLASALARALIVYVGVWPIAVNFWPRLVDSLRHRAIRKWP